MLVCTFTLVSRVLGQSHVDLGLKLIAQVTVLETGRQKCQYTFSTFISELYARTCIIPPLLLLDFLN